MEIRQVDQIKESEVFSQKDVVLTIKRLEILHPSHGPEQWMLASFTNNRDSFAVKYHGGRREWSFYEDQYTAQKAVQYDTVGLEESVKRFEKRLGITLPPIEVVEYGIGIYTLGKKTEMKNPWQLHDGVVYHAVDALGTGRDFLAKQVGDVMEVAQLDKQGQPREFCHPRWVFSKAEWKTLKPADQETAPSPARTKPMRP